MSIKLIKIYLSRKAANLKMSQSVPNIQGIFNEPVTGCYVEIFSYNVFNNFFRHLFMLKFFSVPFGFF